MRLRVIFPVFLFTLVGALLCSGQMPAFAQGADSPAFRSSGLPIPRFVSLRSDKVFMRVGPGKQYPIKWVYERKWLPVEVILEFDTWRKIRDQAGEEGWVHQSMLSGRRTALVIAGEPLNVFSNTSEKSRKRAVFEPGVVGFLETCKEDWCWLQSGGYSGWAKRNLLWGIYESENLQ